jgi:hypothetical protein
MEKTARRGPRASVATYREDALYPRIARAVSAILRRGKVVAPVDVLVEMGVLAPERLEDWRRGRVPFLEQVITCNLTRLSRLLRILRFHAHDLKLVPSITVYVRWGKGPKQRLRFTRSGDPRLEEAYARHFVWPSKGPSHLRASRKVPQRPAEALDGGDGAADDTPPTGRPPEPAGVEAGEDVEDSLGHGFAGAPASGELAPAQVVDG